MKNIEMKIYEKIGVLQFKRFILWLSSVVRKNPEERRGTNYCLRSIDLESIKDFRKMLIFNAKVHLVCIVFSYVAIIEKIFLNNIFSIQIIIDIVIFIVNLYCIMLQRYNWIRIKMILNKVAQK